VDGQDALLQGPGVVEVALVVQDEGEVVEALGGVGVVGARSGAPSPVRVRATWSVALRARRTQPG
jgi:hypothetical protein